MRVVRMKPADKLLRQAGFSTKLTDMRRICTPAEILENLRLSREMLKRDRWLNDLKRRVRQRKESS